jgi:hypothetical protein
LDMVSRRVLGFALGEHHAAELAYGALAMAVAVRGGQVPRVIFHTDGGSGVHRPVVPGCLRPAGRLPVDGPARIRPGQRGHRVLALDSGMGSAARGALRYQSPGQGQGRRLDRGVQHHPQALIAGHAQPFGLRAGAAGRKRGLTMSPLPRHPGCAGARPRPGRSSPASDALRGLHLDTTCAPAVTWQLTKRTRSKISSNQSVHAFRGTPEATPACPVRHEARTHYMRQ